MLHMKKISFCIPCYRSEKTIEKVVNDIHEVMDKKNNIYETEIVCVVDGSPDNVYDTLAKMAESDTSLKVINLSNKFCQNFIVNFNFTLPISQPVINNFILKDALYSLPINEAILSFKLQN